MTKPNPFTNRILGYGTKPADQFTANPANWRTHPQKQRDAVQASLRELGWIGVVVENRRTGLLIDGHERVWQALANNEDVPYIEVDLSPDEEKLALAVFDPITYMAETDSAVLDALLREVSTGEAALQELLASMAEDAGLYQDEKRDVDAAPQVDRADELRQKWQTATGQLWQLGEHRLICGDCTDAEVVARVMGGEKADMVFTDPPYNVASESRNYAADKSKAIDDLKNAEWDKDFDISTFFPTLEAVMAKDCAVYICTSHWLVQKIWEWMWTWSDFCFYNVWCKPNPMPSLSKRHWTWATELIAYAVRGKHVSNFPDEGHALNWWAIPKAKDTDHPTEKVLEVVTRPIAFSSNPGAIVFDGFSGSGTTIIACEQLGRKCRAVEISPAYVAVALERYVDATGREPVRVG